MCTCMFIWVPYLSGHHMGAFLAVCELVHRFAFWQKQQYVGGVGYFQIVGCVTTAEHSMLLFIPPDHQTGKRRKWHGMQFILKRVKATFSHTHTFFSHTLFRSNLHFSILPEVSACRQKEQGIRLLSFLLVDDPLYPLSHSRPKNN